MKETNIPDFNSITYCRCGFPTQYMENGEIKIIEELANHEVDVRSFREFFYCPHCNKVIDIIQY